MLNFQIGNQLHALLFNQQQIGRAIENNHQQMAAGKKAPDAQSDFRLHFSSLHLLERAANIERAADRNTTIQGALNVATKALASVDELVSSMRALSEEAARTTDISLRAGLAISFVQTRDQIVQLAGDASFNGQNLLIGTEHSLTMVQESSAPGLQIRAVDLTDLTTLDTPLSLPGNGWASLGDVQQSQSELDAFQVWIEGVLARFLVDQAHVDRITAYQTRQSFELQGHAESLNRLDMNKASALALSLDTQYQLATQSQVHFMQNLQGFLTMLRS